MRVFGTVAVSTTLIQGVHFGDRAFHLLQDFRSDGNLAGRCQLLDQLDRQRRRCRGPEVARVEGDFALGVS